MRKVLLATLYALTLLGVAALAWRGRTYYSLPLAARPRHPLHWELKPGGELGRWYGVAGLSAMVLMLAYSARKRWPWMRGLGQLGTWLDLHIYLGIVGPLLIVLHSALKVGGLVAVAFWSMVAVAVSGIFGRFLYAQIPRSAAGDQLTLDEAIALERHLSASLQRELGGPASLARLTTASEAPRAGGSAASELVGLALAPLRARQRLARWRRELGPLPPGVARQLSHAMRQRALLQQRLRLWRRLHELFHYWHVFHKPFAIVMYLLAALHVGVAWLAGYAWSPK